jgi:hypothetical protein
MDGSTKEMAMVDTSRQEVPCDTQNSERFNSKCYCKSGMVFNMSTKQCVPKPAKEALLRQSTTTPPPPSPGENLEEFGSSTAPSEGTCSDGKIMRVGRCWTKEQIKRLKGLQWDVLARNSGLLEKPEDIPDTVPRVILENLFLANHTDSRGTMQHWQCKHGYLVRGHCICAENFKYDRNAEGCVTEGAIEDSTIVYYDDRLRAALPETAWRDTPENQLLDQIIDKTAMCYYKNWDKDFGKVVCNIEKLKEDTNLLQWMNSTCKPYDIYKDVYWCNPSLFLARPNVPTGCVIDDAKVRCPNLDNIPYPHKYACTKADDEKEFTCPAIIFANIGSS